MEVYPSESNQQVPANMSLNDFCNDVGITNNIKSDRAPEFCGRNSELILSDKQKIIDLTYAEPERRNQIAPVDVEIRELSNSTHKKLKQRTCQVSYGTIAWCINPTSDSSCLGVSCESGQKCIMLLVRHQTYMNNVIYIFMTWFGTIQGSILTVMIKIGLWFDS